MCHITICYLLYTGVFNFYFFPTASILSFHFLKHRFLNISELMRHPQVAHHDSLYWWIGNTPTTCELLAPILQQPNLACPCCRSKSTWCWPENDILKPEVKVGLLCSGMHFFFFLEKMLVHLELEKDLLWAFLYLLEIKYALTVTPEVSKTSLL